MQLITKQDPAEKTGIFLVFSLYSPTLLHVMQEKKTTVNIRTGRI